MAVAESISLGAALAARYTLERELGRGGMATVYLATDLTLHRQVALKVLRGQLAAAVGAERFQREIEIAAQLSHPNILTLFESGQADGRLFYAMPYVEGESLRQRLEREGPLSVAESIQILRAVAGALDYAHRAGVIHRDLKPENILLAPGPGDGGPHPLLADFGIARALDVAGGQRLTETGLALGTPAYMSPEQAAGGGRLDARSDVYALGCVAYEMLAGAPPFTGPTAQAVLARHAVDAVPPLRTVRSTVPVATEQAIQRALAKVPADRFPTAGDFAQALVAHDDEPALRKRPYALHWILAGVLITLAMAAVAGAPVWTGRADTPEVRASVVPSAMTIAVLPLSPAGPDTALLRLGRDLAVTIGANLDGIGGIDVADQLSIASETADRTELGAADAAALARRFGAGSVLRGTLVRIGEHVRLDLGLYDSERLTPLAEGIRFTGHRDSLGPLSDSVAWTVLRKVWQRGEPPSPSLGAVTTRSIPALRAFLNGERDLVAGRWDEAAMDFGGAIAADSGFWIAYSRYALAQIWRLQPIEPVIGESLRLHREALPERERVLVAALLDSMAPAERAEQLRIMTQRFHDYWPGWLSYADMLYHWGMPAGYDRSEVFQAFRRAVGLNPRLVPAWVHMFELVVGRDSTEAAYALDRLTALGWPPPEDGLMRLVVGLSRTSGVISPVLSVLADSLADLIAFATPQYVQRYGAPGLPLTHWGFPAAQLQLNRRSLRSSVAVDQRLRTALPVADAWAWAARGQWDSALTLMATTVKIRPGVIGLLRYPTKEGDEWNGAVLALESYGIAVLAAWLGAVEPAVALPRRPAALEAIATLPEVENRREAMGRLAWLDGLLAYTQGSRESVRAARTAAELSGAAQSALIDRSLAAFDRALSGDRQRAGRELADLELECINREDCDGLTPHLGVQRLAAARWMGEAGQTEPAIRLLHWPDARSWGGWQWTFNDAVAAPTYLLRAQLREAKGDTGRAVSDYETFLGRYDTPVAAHAHLVAETRRALARLRGRKAATIGSPE